MHESQATQSTNITATEEASQTASKEASSPTLNLLINLYLLSQATFHIMNKPHLRLKQLHILVLKRLQHKTLLQRSIIIHLKVLPFHKKKLHLNLLNDDNTSSQEKASSESTSNENNTSQFHGTEVKPSPSTSEQNKSTQVEPTKESTSTKVKQTPQEPTQQQQSVMFQNHNNLHLLQSKCLKITILHQNKQHRNLNM